MGTLGVLLAMLPAVFGARISDEYKCYAEEENQYLYFGTKTSYAVMFKNSTPPFQSEGELNKTIQLRLNKGCPVLEHCGK